MIRTQIQLKEAQYRSLKELAARQRTSVAELIRQAVEVLLKPLVQFLSWKASL